MSEEYFSQAVKKLRTRAYSRAEMEQYLLSLGANLTESEAVLERLVELAYLDDLRLAQQICLSNRRAKPCGHLLLSRKLKQRGISGEIIEQLLTDCSAEEEYCKAKELATVYLRAKATRSPIQQLRGLAALLQRRGFTMDTIALILSEQKEDC